MRHSRNEPAYFQPDTAAVRESTAVTAAALCCYLAACLCCCWDAVATAASRICCCCCCVLGLRFFNALPQAQHCTAHCRTAQRSRRALTTLENPQCEAHTWCTLKSAAQHCQVIRNKCTPPHLWLHKTTVGYSPATRLVVMLSSNTILPIPAPEVHRRP
jgi:hypothetical protein